MKMFKIKTPKVTKNPKWSMSEQRFVDCTPEYIAAQSDIIPMLVAMGDCKDAINTWCEENNADFKVVK